MRDDMLRSHTVGADARIIDDALRGEDACGGSCDCDDALAIGADTGKERWWLASPKPPLLLR